jgi:hypothetical protein
VSQSGETHIVRDSFERVKIGAGEVQAVLQRALIIPKDQHDSAALQPFVETHHSEKFGHLMVHVYNISHVDVAEAARDLLDAYTMSLHVCQLIEPLGTPELRPPPPSDAISSILQEAQWFGRGPADTRILL